MKVFFINLQYLTNREDSEMKKVYSNKIKMVMVDGKGNKTTADVTNNVRYNGNISINGTKIILFPKRNKHATYRPYMKLKVRNGVSLIDTTFVSVIPDGYECKIVSIIMVENRETGMTKRIVNPIFPESVTVLGQFQYRNRYHVYITTGNIDGIRYDCYRHTGRGNYHSVMVE